jgi:hypothetical protein
MNRPWLIPLVAAVAVGLLAFGITKMTPCGRPAPSIDRLQDVTFLAHELNLSETQAKEIKQLHLTLATELNDCCMNHCAARARLGQALASDSNGTARADAIVAEMCRAYEASERATLDHIRNVRALLNADQRKRFDVMISSCMCLTCSMPNE